MISRNQFSHYKTVRTGVGTSYTHLIQPTDKAADWTDNDFIMSDHACPGGIPSGHLRLSSREPGGDAPHKEAYMQQQVTSAISRDAAVTTIANIRAEWQLGAGNESLICIRASVGLFLADIVIGLGLTPHEQEISLGTALFQELEQAGVLTAGNGPEIPTVEFPEWVPEAWVLSEQQ